jgi:hypothetical protein
MKKNLLFLSLSVMCMSINAMELDQSTEIQSLTSKQRMQDVAYGAFVIATTIATICDAVWEESTLQSDYFGAEALSVGAKINTAVTVGLGIADMIWLHRPYCAFSRDTPEEDNRWSVGIMAARIAAGFTRSSVASILGVCAGIRRYPRTLAIMILNSLVDFAGAKNAENHKTVIDEIEKLKNKAE